MTSKLKANIIKNACAVAADIAKAEHEAGNLANALLQSVHAAREAGLSVDTVWAEIARNGGYQDKAAKLEGVAMPKTLQTYRSRMRKGDKLGANFGLSWPLFVADLKRLGEAERAPHHNAKAVDQSTGTGEGEGSEPKEVKLAEIAVPAALVRAIADKRMGLSVEKRAIFDAKVAAWVAAYGV